MMVQKERSWTLGHSGEYWLQCVLEQECLRRRINSGLQFFLITPAVVLQNT